MALSGNYISEKDAIFNKVVSSSYCWCDGKYYNDERILKMPSSHFLMQFYNFKNFNICLVTSLWKRFDCFSKSFSPKFTSKNFPNRVRKNNIGRTLWKWTDGGINIAKRIFTFLLIASISAKTGQHMTWNRCTSKTLQRFQALLKIRSSHAINCCAFNLKFQKISCNQ